MVGCVPAPAVYTKLGWQSAFGAKPLHNFALAAPPSPWLQERERQRALEQKKGALTILDQLAERERGRAASDEARRQEGEAMKRRIQALKEEEQRVGG